MAFFGNTSPDKAAAICAKIEDKRLSLKEQMAELENALSQALLASIDGGPKELAAVEKARNARDKKEIELRDVEGMLAAAKNQYSEALQKHADLLKAEKRRQIREHTVEIRRLAERWEQTATELHNCGAEIQRHGAAAQALALETEFPKSELIDGLLSSGRIEAQFRNFLFKLGHKWAFMGSLQTAHQMPTFVEQMNEACNWIHKYDNPS